MPLDYQKIALTLQLATSQVTFRLSSGWLMPFTWPLAPPPTRINNYLLPWWLKVGRCFYQASCTALPFSVLVREHSDHVPPKVHRRALCVFYAQLLIMKKDELDHTFLPRHYDGSLGKPMKGQPLPHKCPCLVLHKGHVPQALATYKGWDLSFSYIFLFSLVPHLLDQHSRMEGDSLCTLYNLPSYCNPLSLCTIWM